MNIYDFIEEVRGTCKYIEEVAYLCDFTLTEEMCLIIDHEIFNCEDCGWWYERCEESEEVYNTCYHCNPDL